MTALRAAPKSLDQASFDAIASLAYRESGLTLVPEKTAMVQSRLRHRLSALGLQDFAQYSSFVHSECGKEERRQLICALTTNVSQFFRETHHFEEMCARVRDDLNALTSGGRFRIWSAGCSNGQEPLSAAMALLEDMPELAERDLRILATDIDAKVIQFARKGIYSDRQLSGVPPHLLSKYFTPKSHSGSERLYKVHPKILEMIQYNELNLNGDWPMRQKYKVIFCRNVIIYFDVETQEALWPRFHNILAQDGVLFLGHSERIADPQSHQFKFTGPTTYRRANPRE